MSNSKKSKTKGYSLSSFSITIILIVYFILCPNLHAFTVNYDIDEYEPCSGLWTDGVVVSGEGLGQDNFGNPFSVDRTMAFESGSMHLTSDSKENVSIWADGNISSITIDPYLKVNGDITEDIIWFEVLLDLSLNDEHSPNFCSISTMNLNPFTVNLDYYLPSSITLSNGSDFGQAEHFRYYLVEHGRPQSTFEFGFKILSIDYTPFEVDETQTTLIPLITVLCLLSFAKKRIEE